MKLHLPKALFTAVMALFAVSQTVWAETYDLLESDTNWAFTGRDAPSYNAENDTITASSAGWKQSLATYALTGRSYYAVDQFAATIDVTGTTGVMSLAFTGLNETFALGDFIYEPTTLQYGKTSDTSSFVYHNGGNWDAGSPGGIDPANDLGVAYAAGSYEIVGTVNYTDGSYTLDLSINGTEVVSDYALGSSFDVTRITFAHDAAANNQPTLSTLTLTGTLTERTVYSTTLAEGSTNASAATWTSGGSSVNYADIAMTDGSSILDFTGADAGSTAVLDAGTNVYAIDISGGSVTLQAAEGGITTSELVVKDNATLKVGSDMTVGSLFSMGSNAAVSVANNSTLDITGTDSQLIIGDSTDEFSALNNKITTEDGSFVKIAFNHSSSAELKLGSNLTLQPNVEAVGALVIHGKGNGYQFIIGEGKTLIAKGSSNSLSGLEAINKAVITINGGTVETTKLTLGHTSPAGDYWGKLDMTAGSLKLDNITLRNNHNNVFSVTGGELEFTSATALTRGSNTASTITIKGADADNTVTLKALTAGWTLDGAGLATAPTVGNVTIDASNTQMITLANVALDGDILNNATTEGAGLTLSGAITAVGGTSTTEKVMAENGYGIITTNVVIDNFKGAGNYVFADGTTINNIAIADFTREGNTFTYSTGEQTSTIYHVVNGTVTMGSVNGLVGSATHTGFDVYSGAILDAAGGNPENITVNLRGGATLANSGADVGNAAGTNVQQIKALSLTGDATVDVDGQLGIVASNLADTTVDLGGYTLTKTGADNFLLMNSAISAGSIDIQEGTIKMYHQSNNGLRVDDAVKVNIEEGANLNIVGAKGGIIDGDFILNSTGTGTINLNRDVNIGSAGGTSTFAGTISVNSNTLYLGNTGDGGSEMEAIDLSAATIALNGGTKVRYFGGTSTIGTLKVDQNGELNVFATNKNAEQGILTINKVSVAADKLLTVSGTWDCNVNVGVLTGNGSINITHSGDNKHYAIKAVDAGFGSITNAANLTLGTASTTVNLGSTLTNTGTVTMLGSLVLSGDAYADFTVSGAQYDTTGDAVADAGATDGYLLSVGSTSFSVVSGGTINKDGITSVTYNGETVSTDSLSIADNKLTLNTQVAITPTKDYHVNTTVDYAAESVVASDATTGIILNGGTLNLNTALNSSATKGIVAAQDSTINIASGVTLNNSSVSSNGGTATIAGDSTAKYSMGVVTSNSANATMNAGISENWKGTVVFESGTTLNNNNFDLDTYANGSNSTVEIAGATGYLGHNDTIKDIDANIKLSGSGLSMTDGYSDKHYTFNGDFSGEGNFTMGDISRGTASFTFKGDMSGWTGTLQQNGGTGTGWTWNYEAADGKNTTIANDFALNKAAGVMNVNVTNAAAVEMTGDVTSQKGTIKLTKDGGSKLTVNNIAANGGNVVLTGTDDNAIEVGNMSIKAGNTVTGAADVTVTNTLNIAAENALALTGALKLSDGVTINLTGLDIVDGKTSYTLATADNGVSLQNYTITGLDLTGTMYEGYRMTISPMDSNAAAGISLLAGEGNTNTNALVLTLEQNTTPLTQVTVTGAQGYDSASNVLTLTTNIADIDDYSGIASTLAATVTDSLWEQLVKDYGIGTLVNIALVDGAGNYFDLDGADGVGTDDVALTINGIGVNTPAPTYSAVGNGAAVGPYVTSYIPEPTTGTLSILALAGLMIRRRRR